MSWSKLVPSGKKWPALRDIFKIKSDNPIGIVVSEFSIVP